MEIQFPKQSIGSADSQAALALVVGVYAMLEQKGLLSKDDLREAVTIAERTVPRQPNVRDRECLELLAKFKLSI